MLTSARGRMRFKEVPPPFDERVATGLLSRGCDVVLLFLRIKDSVSETGSQAAELANNQTYMSHVGSSVANAITPGTVPFALIAIAIALYVSRVVFVYVEVGRTMRGHASGFNHQKTE